MDTATEKKIEDLEERIVKLERLLNEKKSREITIKSDDKTLVITSEKGLITDVKETK